MIQPEHWAGENPFFLAIEHDEQITLIDLDQPGWATTHADLMRAVGVWYLTRKNGEVVFSMRVLEGEQPYYVGRHVGIAGSLASTELICYGIGKKRAETTQVVMVDGRRVEAIVPGVVDRIWILPSHQVVVGDDIEWFALRLLRERIAEEGL